MKRFALVLSLLAIAFSDAAVEQRVLSEVRQVMADSGGRVTFSDLHNDSRFGAEERAFLAKLYEIFFQIPPFLKEDLEQTGKLPTRARIGQRFAISPASVELLLRVMEADPRVPPMFSRDPDSGEVIAVSVVNIQQFVRARGSEVRLGGWEGKPVPQFDLETLDGKRISRQDLEGKHSLLYFWFTGCPPCVRIAPILSRLDREYSSEKFQVIGLNADRVLGIEVGKEQRDQYLAKSETKYVNAHLDAAARKAFGNVNVYPMLFFVDEEGTIVRHLLNFQDEATLATIVKEMLGE